MTIQNVRLNSVVLILQAWRILKKQSHIYILLKTIVYYYSNRVVILKNTPKQVDRDNSLSLRGAHSYVSTSETWD